MTLFVLDPSKLPGVPSPLPKGWGANDWDMPRWVDVLEALRGAVVAPDDVQTSSTLVSIDPTYPTDIELPPAIIALEPDRGIPLPAGEVGLLAGQGGERKSTLTIQMGIAAAAAEDGRSCPRLLALRSSRTIRLPWGALGSRCAVGPSAWRRGKTRRRGSRCAHGLSPRISTHNQIPSATRAS